MNEGRYDIKKYINLINKEISQLNEEVDLLSSIGLPLIVDKRKNSFELISVGGYMGANRFEFKKDSSFVGGSSSTYEGGYSVERVDFYPVFFRDFISNGKKYSIRIVDRDDSLDRDTIVKSFQVSRGNGNYSGREHNYVEENCVDLKKALDYLERKKYIGNGLLKLLERRVKLKKDWVI